MKKLIVFIVLLNILLIGCVPPGAKNMKNPVIIKNKSDVLDLKELFDESDMIDVSSENETNTETEETYILQDYPSKVDSFQNMPYYSNDENLRLTPME